MQHLVQHLSSLLSKFSFRGIKRKKLRSKQGFFLGGLVLSALFLQACGVTKSESKGGPTLYFSAPILARDVLLHTLTLEGQQQSIRVKDANIIYLDGRLISEAVFNGLKPESIDSILRGNGKEGREMFVISRNSGEIPGTAEALLKFKSAVSGLSSLKIIVISEEEKKQALEEEKP